MQPPTLRDHVTRPRLRLGEGGSGGPVRRRVIHRSASWVTICSRSSSPIVGTLRHPSQGNRDYGPHTPRRLSQIPDHETRDLVDEHQASPTLPKDVLMSDKISAGLPGGRSGSRRRGTPSASTVPSAASSPVLAGPPPRAVPARARHTRPLPAASRTRSPKTSARSTPRAIALSRVRDERHGETTEPLRDLCRRRRRRRWQRARRCEWQNRESGRNQPDRRSTHSGLLSIVSRRDTPDGCAPGSRAAMIDTLVWHAATIRDRRASQHATDVKLPLEIR
jgi:hypothetical protein